jgi:hypothetical protein
MDTLRAAERGGLMKVPILQGAYADSNAAFRTSLPVNLEPVLVDSGISKGYLTNAPGVAQIGTGPGADRGAISWNDICYRVMGSKLVQVIADGTVTVLGEVGTDSKPVRMDYSFDLLSIASNRNLFYYNPVAGTVLQVTDPDLGPVLDAMWIDGYFMTTDGENAVVTELSDPYSVDPLKYGSSESDPDPVVGLRKVRGEAYVINRYTIQNLQDIGGDGFPFTNNPGGLVSKGATGTHAIAYFLESFAFVGSGRNEQNGVYVAGAGTADKISNSEVDLAIAALSMDQIAAIELETRIEQDEERLYVHLPTRSFVYMRQASLQAQVPIWHAIADGARADLAYTPRHMALTYGKWLVGDVDGRLGTLDYSIETHFGEIAGWQFDTSFLYNEGKAVIVKTVELVGLPGRTPFGTNPGVSLSLTQDGQTWSIERVISMGQFGERQKRVQWRPKIRGKNYFGMRFRGANTAMAAWAACQVELEGLAV